MMEIPQYVSKVSADEEHSPSDDNSTLMLPEIKGDLGNWIVDGQGQILEGTVSMLGHLVAHSLDPCTSI